MTLIANIFEKVGTTKDMLDKCLKSLISEDRPTSNKVLKHYWNLYVSTLIIFINHY